MDRDLSQYLDALGAWGRDQSASDEAVAERLLAADERLSAQGGALVLPLRELGIDDSELDGQVLDRRGVRAAVSSDLGAVLVRSTGPGRNERLARGAQLLRAARSLYLELGDREEALLAAHDLLSALIELSGLGSATEASEALSLAVEITTAPEAPPPLWWQAARARGALGAMLQDVPEPERRARADEAIALMSARGSGSHPSADASILLSECLRARVLPEADGAKSAVDRLQRAEKMLNVLRQSGDWSLWACLMIECAAMRNAIGERAAAQGDLDAAASEVQLLERPYRDLYATLARALAVPG